MFIAYGKMWNGIALQKTSLSWSDFCNNLAEFRIHIHNCNSKGLFFCPSCSKQKTCAETIAIRNTLIQVWNEIKRLPQDQGSSYVTSRGAFCSLVIIRRNLGSAWSRLSSSHRASATKWPLAARPWLKWEFGVVASRSQRLRSYNCLLSQ